MQYLFASNISKQTTKKFDLIPEIKNIKPKELIYIRIIAKYGSAKDYSNAWEKLTDFAHENNLIDKNTEFIGISFDDPKITKPESCRYYACITTEKDIKAEKEFGRKTIDAGKFAVFTLKGAYSELNDFYNAIYFQWLVQSTYELRNGISFEKYIYNHKSNSDTKNITEIYLPIK